MEKILEAIDKIDNDIFELEEKLSHLKQLEIDKKFEYWYNKSKDIVDDWIFDKTLKEAKSKNVSHDELKDTKSLEIAHGETLLRHRIEYLSKQLAKKKRAYERKLKQYNKLQGRTSALPTIPETTDTAIANDVGYEDDVDAGDNTKTNPQTNGLENVVEKVTTNGLEGCIHLQILGQPCSMTKLKSNVKKVRKHLSPDNKPLELRSDFDKLLKLYLELANEVMDNWDEYYDPKSTTIPDKTITEALSHSHPLICHVERFNRIYNKN